MEILSKQCYSILQMPSEWYAPNLSDDDLVPLLLMSKAKYWKPFEFKKSLESLFSQHLYQYYE